MNAKHVLIALNCLALPVFAQDSKVAFEAHGSMLIASGDLKKDMVEKAAPGGYSIGVGIVIPTVSEFQARAYADMVALKGGIKGSGLEGATPKHLNFGLDLALPSGSWTFFGGISAMKWRQDEAQITSSAFGDVVPGVAGNSNNLGKGVKLGYRAGVEYSLTNVIRANITFTQVEFNKRYQPSWFSLGVSYRFSL